MSLMFHSHREQTVLTSSVEALHSSLPLHHCCFRYHYHLTTGNHIHDFAASRFLLEYGHCLVVLAEGNREFF